MCPCCSISLFLIVCQAPYSVVPYTQDLRIHKKYDAVYSSRSVKYPSYWHIAASSLGVILPSVELEQSGVRLCQFFRIGPSASLLPGLDILPGWFGIDHFSHLGLS